jgi:hypothetical protein
VFLSQPVTGGYTAFQTLISQHTPPGMNGAGIAEQFMHPFAAGGAPTLENLLYHWKRTSGLTWKEHWLLVALSALALRINTGILVPAEMLTTTNIELAHLIRRVYNIQTVYGTATPSDWIPAQCNQRSFLQLESPTCYIAATITLIYNTRLYRLVERRATEHSSSGAMNILQHIDVMVRNSGIVHTATGTYREGFGLISADWYTGHEGPGLDTWAMMAGRGFRSGSAILVLLSIMQTAGVPCRTLQLQRMPDPTTCDWHITSGPPLVVVVRIKARDVPNIAHSPITAIRQMWACGNRRGSAFLGSLVTLSDAGPGPSHVVTILQCHRGPGRIKLKMYNQGRCNEIRTTQELYDRVGLGVGWRVSGIISIFVLDCTESDDTEIEMKREPENG